MLPVAGVLMQLQTIERIWAENGSFRSCTPRRDVLRGLIFLGEYSDTGL